MSTFVFGTIRWIGRQILAAGVAGGVAFGSLPAHAQDAAQPTSAPGAVGLDGNFFVIKDAGTHRIQIHEWNRAGRTWINHGTYGDHLAYSAPSSRSHTGGFYFTSTDPTSDPGNELRLLSWQPGGPPQILERQLGYSTPHTPSDVMYLNRVFLTAGSSNLYERFVRWADHRIDRGFPEKRQIPPQKPCVMGDGHVFVTSVTGHLLELWESPWGWIWGDHERPQSWPWTVKATHVGAGMASGKVFVTCDDGTLRQRWWNGWRWEWHNHGTPFGWRVDSPAVALHDGELFVTGDWDHKGGNIRTLLQLRYDYASGTWRWTDHGRPFGVSIDEVGAAVAAGGNLVVVKGVDGNYYGRFWNGWAWVWESYGRP